MHRHRRQPRRGRHRLRHKALGGLIHTRPAPSSDDERQRDLEAGLQSDHFSTAEELVTSDNTFVVATGVTDSQIVAGVRRKGPIIRAESTVLRAHSGTIRYVRAEHLAEKCLES